MADDQLVAANRLDTYQERLDHALSTWPVAPALFTRANAIDQWPKPITPLTQELIALPQERGLEDAFVSELGVSKPSPPWTWNGVFYGWVTYGVEPSAELADNMPGWSRVGIYADYFGVSPDPDAPPPPKVKVNPLALAGVGRNFVRALRGYPRRSEQMRADAERQLREDLARNWSEVTDSVLAERIAGHLPLHRAQRVPHALASVISAALFEQVAGAIGKLAGDDGPALVSDAVSALGGIHLAEASKALAKVAAGEMSRADFVDRYGFRGTNEFELAAKPWSEDPSTLDRLIEAAGKARTDRALERREAARARIQKLAGLRWPVLRWQLGMLETHMRWRENGKIPLALSAHSLRLVVREAAVRLVARGRIDALDDVFFLRSTELAEELAGNAVDGLKTTVDRRKETHKLAADLPLPEMMDAQPDRLTLITRERWAELGVLPPAELDTSAPSLTGLGGAPGQVTGRARIVTEPNEIDIEDGDILVAAGTDSAWTPLFLQAAGVVVDVGGTMSHCSIAAREIGIPCVVNVKQGTTRITEGQTITVDGGSGTVTFS